VRVEEAPLPGDFDRLIANHLLARRQICWCSLWNIWMAEETLGFFGPCEDNVSNDDP
jgi:hypothetical protein